MFMKCIKFLLKEKKRSKIGKIYFTRTVLERANYTHLRLSFPFAGTVKPYLRPHCFSSCAKFLQRGAQCRKEIRGEKGHFLLLATFISHKPPDVSSLSEYLCLPQTDISSMHRDGQRYLRQTRQSFSPCRHAHLTPLSQLLGVKLERKA